MSDESGLVLGVEDMPSSGSLVHLIEQQVCDYRPWDEQTRTARERIPAIAAGIVKQNKLHSINLASPLQRGALVTLLTPIYKPLHDYFAIEEERVMCRTVYWYLHMNSVWLNLHNYLISNGFSVENTESFIAEGKAAYC